MHYYFLLIINTLSLIFLTMCSYFFFIKLSLQFSYLKYNLECPILRKEIKNGWLKIMQSMVTLYCSMINLWYSDKKKKEKNQFMVLCKCDEASKPIAAKVGGSL